MKNIEYRALPELVGGTTDTHTLRSELCTLHSHARTGMILLVVIIIVAMLSLAGYAFMALMNSELNSARQRGRDVQVQYISQSGVALIESVATLSQNERQWTGGTYDNPSLFCAAAIDGEPFRTIRSPRFTIVAPKLDNSRMAGIRYGLINESAKLHLAKVLEWETANPGDGVNALRQLPGMTTQIAESLLDWIDADDRQRPGGAESAWYSQQRLPYRPRNAVPVTLEEFLLVRDVTRQLMFGDDENVNFVPDGQEAHLAQIATTTTVGGFAQPAVASPGQAPVSTGIPWCHLLTVISAERDANPRGVARIDLNDANLQFLHTQLTQRVGLEIADFVILYRQYGTVELSNQAAQPDSDSTVSPDTTGMSSREARLARRAQMQARTQSASGSITDNANAGTGGGNDDTGPPTTTLPGELPSMLSPGELPGNMPSNTPEDLPDLSVITPAEPPPPLALPNDAVPPTRGTQTRTRPASGRQSAGPPPTDQPSTDSPTTSAPATSSEPSPPVSTPQGRPGRTPQERSATGQVGAGRQFQGQGGGRFGSRNSRESRFSQYVDLQTPAQYRLETPLDIVGATVVIPQNAVLQPPVSPAPASVSTTPATSAPGEPPGIRLGSPLEVNSSSLNSGLIIFLDETSTAASTTIVGRININEAPYEVIAAIPGLSQTAARQIVNRREQQANGIREMYRQPTWLLAYNIVDLPTLRKIWPHITCGGDVFRGQVISFYEDIGTFSRVDAAVDATVFPPRLVDFKDLTSHGIGFHDRVLFGNIPRQGSGGAVGSTAPTMAGSFGSGASFSDMGSGFSGTGVGMPPMQQPSYMQPGYSEIAPLE